MKGWLDIMDAGFRRVQSTIEIDEIYLAEDICFNHGLLISPDTMREFLALLSATHRQRPRTAERRYWPAHRHRRRLPPRDSDLQ